MAYDEQLAERIRQVLADQSGVSERRMFGGIGFLLNGNMCCGVSGDELILRLGGEGGEAALEDSNVRPFDMTGRPMKGWVLVAAAGLGTDDALRRWVGEGVDFAASLPPK
jgi:TfoX/Sxy family transcriptional regulator of competence genes